jgi:chemotaxis protein MotB
MPRARSSFRFAGAALAVTLVTGCAHSEDEWQAKVREVSDLKARLDKAESEHGSSQKAREDADAKLERLEKELRTAGIDPAQIAANVEQQARAMEEHRRRTEQIGAAKKRFATLKEKLAPLAGEGVVVTVRNNRIVVQLPGDVVFDKNRETLTAAGKKMLARIAEVIRGDAALAARSYQVAGHVDSGKPGGAFKDGWGLSSMRAREALALLIAPADKGGGGLSASRWSAAGYGDGDPLKGADTPEGKAQNRRLEIVALPNVEETIDLAEIGR